MGEGVWEGNFYPLYKMGTTDHITILFGLETFGEPRNTVLDGGPDPSGEEGKFNTAFANLLWLLIAITIALYCCACSHALEAYTALPYTERMPRPMNPKYRPAYQGSNPFSDVWAKEAMRILHKYFRRWQKTRFLLLKVF